MFNGICALAKTNKVTPIGFPDRQICCQPESFFFYFGKI
jgi:hypothetical protein